MTFQACVTRRENLDPVMSACVNVVEIAVPYFFGAFVSSQIIKYSIILITPTNESLRKNSSSSVLH